MAHDIFISYGATDQSAADTVCTALELAGLRCWIAPRDIPAGTSWGGAKAAAIEATRAMVVIWSPDAAASPQVQRDVELGAEAGLAVLGWRLTDFPAEGGAAPLTDRVTKIQMIDAFAGPEQAMALLIDTARQSLHEAPSQDVHTAGSASAANVLPNGASRLPPPIPAMMTPLAATAGQPHMAPRPVLPLIEAEDPEGTAVTATSVCMPSVAPRRQPPPLPATSSGVAASITGRRRTWSRWRVPASAGFLIVVGATGAVFMALRGAHPTNASARPSPMSVGIPPAPQPTTRPGAFPATSAPSPTAPSRAAPKTQPAGRAVVPAERLKAPAPAPGPIISVPPSPPVEASLRRPVDPFADDDDRGTDPPAQAPTNARAVPADPARAAATSAVQALRLETILVSKSRKTCMINHRLYAEGATVDGFLIERVTDTAVVVRRGKYRFELTMNR